MSNPPIAATKSNDDPDELNSDSATSTICAARAEMFSATATGMKPGRFLSVDDDDAATGEQPDREAAVVAVLSPEPDLDWIDRGHPVQLAVDGGRFVEMDWVETDPVHRKLTVTADVSGADLIVIHREIPQKS